MAEILAFIGFVSFLATAIIVIYGWYSWRTDWEQRYEKMDKEMTKNLDNSFKELSDRIQKLENKNLI